MLLKQGCMKVIFWDVCSTVMKYENIRDFPGKKAPGAASTAVGYGLDS